MHINHTTLYLLYNRLPEHEPSVSKHVEDIKKLKFKDLIAVTDSSRGDLQASLRASGR